MDGLKKNLFLLVFFSSVAFGFWEAVCKKGGFKKSGIKLANCFHNVFFSLLWQTLA